MGLRGSAVISSVSDRDFSALREMQRLGLMPGQASWWNLARGTPLISIRIRGAREPIRLSQRLAGEISVVADLG